MSLNGILFYLIRAAAFAVPVTFAFCIVRCLILKKKGQSEEKKKEIILAVFVFYLSSLIGITAIRDGAHLFDWWNCAHSFDTVQLIPLVTTFRQAKNGVWAIVYPIVGNMIWFMPFGYFLCALRSSCRLGNAVFSSFLLSVSIEIMQWILLSGISDIDDVIFNICGGVIGYTAFVLKERSK